MFINNFFCSLSYSLFEIYTSCTIFSTLFFSSWIVLDFSIIIILDNIFFSFNKSFSEYSFISIKLYLTSFIPLYFANSEFLTSKFMLASHFFSPVYNTIGIITGYTILLFIFFIILLLIISISYFNIRNGMS